MNLGRPSGTPPRRYLSAPPENLGDRYVFTGETNGSELPIHPWNVCMIMVSNYPPERYSQREEDLKATKRRFSVVEMTQKNKMMVEHLRLDLEVPAKVEQDQDEEQQGELQQMDFEEMLEALVVSQLDAEEEEW
jgi:hypothetical protein